MRKILLAHSLLTAVSSYALTVDEMLARFNNRYTPMTRRELVVQLVHNVNNTWTRTSKQQLRLYLRPLERCHR